MLLDVMLLFPPNDMDPPELASEVVLEVDLDIAAAAGDSFGLAMSNFVLLGLGEGRMYARSRSSSSSS